MLEIVFYIPFPVLGTSDIGVSTFLMYSSRTSCTRNFQNSLLAYMYEQPLDGPGGLTFSAVANEIIPFGFFSLSYSAALPGGNLHGWL